MKAAQHKRAAKQALKGKWGVAIGVFFLYLIIGGISGMIPIDYYWANMIVLIFLLSPFFVGFYWFYLDLKRLPNPKVETLFDSFSKDYVRVVLTNLLVFIFVFLWGLLLIVPGIIKTYSYSMTFYILRDRKDLSAIEAITESRKMMDGHKWKLFCLMFSFIWWYIIPLIMMIVGLVMMAVAGAGSLADATVMEPTMEELSTLFLGMGIAFIGSIVSFLISIYVTPYYMTSLAVFYDDFVKPKRDTEAPYQNEKNLIDDEPINT
ncbi:DUF975 family protein [Bacillus sp. AGMB 02131]|uniref:DUF975 family protein n=1 Tax=Peribacillus faecalis TaxID=2772559 RepID=A0A927D260_9BACI|nr:DUF975 family protein [Peribacillus faecalis]MBD3110185.1 DUF975 family protein [Peribacillus faecalis]